MQSIVAQGQPRLKIGNVVEIQHFIRVFFSFVRKTNTGRSVFEQYEYQKIFHGYETEPICISG